MRVISLAQYNRRPPKDAIRIDLDAVAGTATIYVAGDSPPGLMPVGLSPQWLNLYSQMLTAPLFQSVRSTTAAGSSNALQAAYSDLGFAIQVGAALEELKSGSGLAAFQTAINNLVAAVSLTDVQKLELRSLLDANGFQAITSPLPVGHVTKPILGI